VTLAFLNLGLSELMVFGVVALLVFGERLPDAMRSLGKVYVRVRRALTEASRPVREEMARIEREVQTQPPAHPHAHPAPPPSPSPAPPAASYPTDAPPPSSSSPASDEPPTP
jgi:Sec-independent protein translocase protein TatA